MMEVFFFYLSIKLSVKAFGWEHKHWKTRKKLIVLIILTVTILFIETFTLLLLEVIQIFFLDNNACSSIFTTS